MISAICIFCEDIREEKTGQDTLIGILPDNLNVTPHPSNPSINPVLTKFCAYIRVSIGLRDHKPRALAAKLLNTDGSLVAEREWEETLIDDAFLTARASQVPIVGFIIKIGMINFPIAGPGIIQGIVTMDGADYPAGVINVMIHPATASEPPSEQSPSAAQASS